MHVNKLSVSSWVSLGFISECGSFTFISWNISKNVILLTDWGISVLSDHFQPISTLDSAQRRLQRIRTHDKEPHVNSILTLTQHCRHVYSSVSVSVIRTEPTNHQTTPVLSQSHLRRISMFYSIKRIFTYTQVSVNRNCLLPSVDFRQNTILID